MAINRYGGGAKTNENGLRFEQETKLEEALRNAGYTVSAQGVVKNNCGNQVALSAPKHNLYKRILKPMGINWKDRISKQLLPDEALLNYTNRTVYIIEKKFQHDSGSVDEKLQTCAFKKQQYQKLFSNTGYNVEYLYVCNDWFSDPRYKDVHEYIHSVGCHIFFDEIPLGFLGLPPA
nr:hypothetical protein [Ruthenibacterium lactatiformans]